VEELLNSEDNRKNYRGNVRGHNLNVMSVQGTQEAEVARENLSFDLASNSSMRRGGKRETAFGEWAGFGFRRMNFR